MFTGLVDALGTIEAVSQSDAGRVLRVASPYDAIVDGESIALNGVCLTVRNSSAGTFDVAAVSTTLERTTVGEWGAGFRVNLERAMRLGDRLGGHLVQGHVDETCVVERTAMQGDALLADIRLALSLVPLMVLHGSVTVDGVSLTVNALPAPGILQISLIEYTRRHTTLGTLAAGQRVNVEADMLGKYVRQLVAPYVAAR